METCTFYSLLPAPLVALALYFILRNKYPQGKFGLVHKTFLLGIAGVFPVFAIDKLISIVHLDSLHSLNRTLFYAFILTGGVFEFWKFIILRVYVYPSKQVVKTIDVIVYSVFIAAGFTFGYSVYAIFFAPAYIHICLYAISIGPAMIAIAILMGYFTGIALRSQHPIIDMLTGLFLAAIFQGIYRFCVLTSDELLLYTSTAGMLIIGISLLLISLREPDRSK